METQPKYTEGQRLIMVLDDGMVLDDNMVVAGDAVWHPYSGYPAGGFWEYHIIGKANMCPEDLLSPYVPNF